MATIHVTGKDSAVSSTNKAHAEEKLSRLAKYFNGIEKIEAVLGRVGDDASIEVVISIPRANPIVCRSQARDLYAAIDLVLDKAETQLTRHKERVRQRKLARREVGQGLEEIAGEAEGLEAGETGAAEEGPPGG
ncbi:MAG: ribosome hibernation-promoting factor, HPF/YfiA family [Planctomycetota bacterium]